jgi:hypothetical protein
MGRGDVAVPGTEKEKKMGAAIELISLLALATSPIVLPLVLLWVCGF